MDAALHIRRNARARRMRLRVDPVTGDALLTLPPGMSEAQGRRFADQHSHWIADQRSALPAPLALTPGGVIPFHGQDHLIDHAPRQPGIILDPMGCRIVCGGPMENFDKRLDRWLRAEARRRLAPRVDHYARLAGRAPKRLRIGDPKSRWGSCSSTGTLSLSWRLVMAPDIVADYVAAHEVAHLQEMNHSPRFWALVETLVGDPAAARQWLARHGARLHRVGITPARPRHPQTP